MRYSSVQNAFYLLIVSVATALTGAVTDLTQMRLMLLNASSGFLFLFLWMWLSYDACRTASRAEACADWAALFLWWVMLPLMTLLLNRASNIPAGRILTGMLLLSNYILSWFCKAVLKCNPWWGLLMAIGAIALSGLVGYLRRCVAIR